MRSFLSVFSIQQNGEVHLNFGKNRNSSLRKKKYYKEIIQYGEFSKCIFIQQYGEVEPKF